MITRELLKQEIDHVQDQYLDALYRVIVSFEDTNSRVSPQNWSAFVKETYGSFSDAPIERGDQGDFENREEMQ